MNACVCESRTLAADAHAARMARTRQAMAARAGVGPPAEHRDPSVWFATSNDKHNAGAAAADSRAAASLHIPPTPVVASSSSSRGGERSGVGGGGGDPLDFPRFATHRASLVASAGSIAEIEARRRGEAAFRDEATTAAAAATAATTTTATRHASGGGGGTAVGAESLAHASFLSRYAADDVDVQLARRQARRARLRSFAAEFTGYCEEAALCALTHVVAPVARCGMRARDGGAAAMAFVSSGGDCEACRNGGRGGGRGASSSSSSSSSYPGVTGTHRFAGRDDDLSKTRGNRVTRFLLTRFSCFDCIAVALLGGGGDRRHVTAAAGGSGSHGFSGGRGGGIGGGLKAGPAGPDLPIFSSRTLPPRSFHLTHV